MNEKSDVKDLNTPDDHWNKLLSHNKKIEKIIPYRKEIETYLGAPQKNMKKVNMLISS